MKILYICADPGVPVFGRKGCSTHVREFYLALRGEGHPVRLVCSNVEGDSAERDRFDLVSVPPFRSRKWGFDLRHILLDRRLEKAADRVIREWRPEAIYERYSLYSRAGTRLAARHNLPHLLEVNAFITREQTDRIRIMPLARAVERSILRKARAVTVVSEPLRTEISALRGGDPDIQLMPMAVNLVLFSPGDGGEVRRRLGLENRFVLGYVGGLTGWHGINLLYDLARRLTQMDAPPFTILLVGGDEKKLAAHREKVRAEGLEDRILFMGPVPYLEVPSHIRAMDGAIVPDTTHWSSPAKLFEYQGCGVPVLAPRYPAIETAMTHRREGMIFEPRNIEQMAESLLELMRNPEGRREMGRRGRELAEKFHSWGAQARTVVELFEAQRAVIEGRGKTG